tara:strand:- start:749 stop:1474 length:726 start_codon:yes stop_codon:yes gene_type:complete
MRKKNKIRIIITGGSGRFGKVLKRIKKSHNVYFPNKNQLNILNITSIKKFLKKIKPKYLIHLAGLSRPLSVHENKINESIDLNIIGTCNITKVCSDLKIKLIYFSTHYVYPGIKGNYKETDPILPYNNYAWSKLGGECAVKLYKNSLILRVCMTENPFVHKKAFFDVKNNFIFHEKIAEKLYKILDLKGIYNLGGAKNTVYKFAKKENPKIKKIYARKIFGKKYPLNQDMDLNKIKKYIDI